MILKLANHPAGAAVITALMACAVMAPARIFDLALSDLAFVTALAFSAAAWTHGLYRLAGMATQRGARIAFHALLSLLAVTMVVAVMGGYNAGDVTLAMTMGNLALWFGMFIASATLGFRESLRWGKAASEPC